jgi:hypothetical protein
MQSESFKQPKHCCLVPSQIGFSGSSQTIMHGGGLFDGFGESFAAVQPAAVSAGAKAKANQTIRFMISLLDGPTAGAAA